MRPVHPTPVRAESPRVADMMRRYAEARARLGAIHQPLPEVLSRDERLANLIRTDTAPLPYVRQKRKRDMIQVGSFDVPSMPVSARKVIVREVCEKHGVSWLDITSDRRSAPIVRARNEAFYRLRYETPMSFPEIGRLMGGKDHSTVIHGVRRHEATLNGVDYKPKTHGRSNKAFEGVMEAAGL